MTSENCVVFFVKLKTDINIFKHGNRVRFFFLWLVLDFCIVNAVSYLWTLFCRALPMVHHGEVVCSVPCEIVYSVPVWWLWWLIEQWWNSGRDPAKPNIFVGHKFYIDPRGLEPGSKRKFIISKAQIIIINVLVVVNLVAAVNLWRLLINRVGICS